MGKKRKRITEKIKDRWVQALRSGEYEQGTGYLCEIDGGVVKYCCLGVLNELVYGKDDWIAPRKTIYSKQNNSESFVRTIDLGEHKEIDVQDKLADFNDAGWSFKKIAAWIEQTYSNWNYDTSRNT